MIAFFLFVSAIQPASATPTEALNFTVNEIYSVPSSSTMYGNWTSFGLLVSSGGTYEQYHSSGYNEDWWFLRNSHSETVLSDASGTISIKAQVHEEVFEPFGYLEFSGTWVITGGTGAYTGLKGQGDIRFTGMFYEVCPANAYQVTGRCLWETKTFTGDGHWE